MVVGAPPGKSSGEGKRRFWGSCARSTRIIFVAPWLVSRRRGRWQLRLDASVAHLLNDERRAEVEQALSVFERGPVQLLIDAGQVQQKTPSVLAAEAREQRQRDAEEAMQRDPVVRALIEELDAELIPGSIRVIDKPKSA